MREFTEEEKVERGEINPSISVAIMYWCKVSLFSLSFVAITAALSFILYSKLTEWGVSGLSPGFIVVYAGVFILILGAIKALNLNDDRRYTAVLSAVTWPVSLALAVMFFLFVVLPILIVTGISWLLR